MSTEVFVLVMIIIAANLTACALNVRAYNRLSKVRARLEILEKKLGGFADLPSDK